jgi:ATP-binding cassette subfamily B protein
VEAHLEAEETPVAWFAPDLSPRLYYVPGLVVLTPNRILSLDPPASAGGDRGKSSGPWGCRSWPLAEDLELRVKEQRGAGVLELVNAGGRLALWRYTPARTGDARRLAERFRGRLRGPTAVGEEEQPAELVCPSCGAVLPGEQGFCAACGAATVPRPARTLLRLLHFLRRQGGMAILGILLAIASTACGMIPPYLTRPILDNFLIPHQDGKVVNFLPIVWYLAGMAGASVLAWVLGWGRSYVIAWVAERVTADLRNQTYARLQRLSMEYFGGKRTGDLISRISTDGDRINTFLSVYLLDFANDVLMILMTAVFLLKIDFTLALATLVPLPVIAWLANRIRSRLRDAFQVANRAWAAMTSVLADSIPGIRVVKAFAQERREIDRFRRTSDRILHTNDRVNRLWAFYGSVITLLTEIGLLCVWIVGVWQVFHHHVTIGVLNMFLLYIARFYGRLDSMSRFVASVQRAGASAQRIFSIMDQEATVPEPVHPVRPGRLRGRIEFRDVGFRYGNRLVVDGVNLTIEPGEMLGLVGPSGSGKTTLVNLACRFYDVSEGAVLVDGTDVRSFPVEEYRRHIGLVLQEPFLFYGTIAENIAYGRCDAPRAEIVAAARAARAHEFILRLPDGYDSLVGERGQFLSGGERQRISIARALLIDPRILILDEATSSVDTETEREIQLALENLIRGRTTLAIAHRLSTLARADRLVVIDRGRIVEAGRHQELLDRDGTYARLWRAQAESGEDRSP